MKIRVLAFGICKEILGGTSHVLSVPENCTVATLMAELKSAFPALSQLRALAIAVDGEYATDTTVIFPTSEIALIPPVSGG